MSDAVARGTLRAYHIWRERHRQPVVHRTVATPAEAFQWIERRASRQVHDESISWNTLGLEVMNDAGEWEEWYDDEGRDIDEHINAIRGASPE